MGDLYLVGVDGSESSRRAAHLAAEMARHSGARLLLAHVVQVSAGIAMAPEAPELRVGLADSEHERAAAEMLAGFATDARGLGCRVVETEILHGDPATALAELAAERAARQIFVGRHGHSRVHEILFGSVLLSLGHKAAVPVTLVP